MANIAYIGVGNMGRAMILRLLKAGHQITAYNRTPEKAKAVVDAGAKLAKTPAEAVEGADVGRLPDEGDRRGFRRLGVGIAHQRRGHVARVIFHVEPAGNFDLLHFFARRHRDAERAHAAVQVTAIDAHQLSGSRNVSFRFFQLPLDELAMIGLSRFFK